MNGLFEAAAEMEAFLKQQGWSFCFIGGLAVLRWGEPRMTQDVDLALLAGFGGEADYIANLLCRLQFIIALVRAGTSMGAGGKMRLGEGETGRPWDKEKVRLGESETMGQSLVSFSHCLVFSLSHLPHCPDNASLSF